MPHRSISAIWGYILLVALTICYLGISLGVFFSNQLRQLSVENRLANVQAIVMQESDTHLESKSVFTDWNNPESQAKLSEFVGQLNSIPEQVRIIVFNPEARIVWSDTREKPRGVVEELEHVTIAIEDGIFVEKAGEATTQALGKQEVLEIYVPIYLDSPVAVGVVNVYYDNSHLLQQIDAARQQVIISTLLIVFITSMLIYGVFHQQNTRLAEQTKLLESYSTELEKRVMKRTLELSESKQQYKDIIDNSLVGVFKSHTSGKIIFANQAIANIIGIKTVDDVIGTDVKSLYANLEDRNRLLKTLKENGRVSNFDFLLIDRNGIKKNILLSATLTGEVLSGMMLDISDRKQFEVKVSELEQLKTRFITILSHATRTPLTAIRWNLESILSGEFGKLKSEQSAFIRRSLDSEMNLIRLIDNMNTILEIEKKTLTIDSAPFSISNLITSVLEETSNERSLKNITFRIDQSEEVSPEIFGDIDKIRQVLRVLIGNTINYSQEGEAAVITIQKKKGMVTICILDHGIGIPSGEQKHVFQRFYRASNAQLAHPDGVGIGLSIAKVITEMHGGTLTFRSTESKETTFCLSLPEAKLSI